MRNHLQHWRERLRKDGWLWAVLLGALLLCLLFGAAEAPVEACTDEEARLERILSAINGAGKVDAAVFYAADEAGQSIPCGAVIVADGAHDAAVQLRLSSAVATLLGLDNNQIDIFQRKEE